MAITSSSRRSAAGTGTSGSASLATGRAAAELHVHPNTLTYRLRRFERLTGRDLTSTSDLVETWLALRAARDLGRV